MIGQAALSWSSAWTAHAGCSGGCCCLTALGSPPFRPRGLRRSLSWRLDESEAVAAWHNGSALCRGLAPRYNMTCDDDHCAEGRPRRRPGLSDSRFVSDPARAGRQASADPVGSLPTILLRGECGLRHQRPDKPAIGSNVDTAKPSARFARISGSFRSSHSRAFFRPSSNSSCRNSAEQLNLLDAS
jgi:hypothetical protein